MTLNASSSLRDVAFEVCTALQTAGITAVLTGGSAAAIWTNGAYQSHDCDFIVTVYKPETDATAALATVGYSPKNNYFVHLRSRFIVEFPAGPLSVGDEVIGKWDVLREGNRILNVLSPTDSCRDRLAAFYHWNDFSSLKTAVMIAACNPVNLRTIARWSRGEGAEKQYLVFKRQLAVVKGRSKI